MAVCNYYCTDLGEHERLSCEKKFGGWSAFAVVKCDHSITDWSNVSQWESAIASGDATVVKDIKGMFPEPSAVENESLVGCARPNEVDSYDRTFTWRDGNVSDGNNDFYNDLVERRFYLVAYNCEEDEIWVIDNATVDFNVRLIGPELKSEKQHYAGTAAWQKLLMPEIATAPAGIFD